MQVHEFDSTGEAYDATQCDENIKDGDVLVIKDEQVVGVADTWPVAVTKESGQLHGLNPDSTPEQWAETDAHLQGWKAAVEKAKELGYALSH